MLSQSRKFAARSGQLKTFEGEDQWVVSYADMISAILAVLLLMFSFTKIDLNKIDALHQINSTKKPIETLQDLSTEINKAANEHGLENELKVILDEDGLALHFQNVAWFDSGKHKINEASLSSFNPIFDVVKKASNTRRIDIEGHTDDVLGVNSSQDTNWRLSSERSLALLSYLMKLGFSSETVRLVAYADKKPFKNIEHLEGTELERARSQNRRVTIYIGKLANG